MRTLFKVSALCAAMLAAASGPSGAVDSEPVRSIDNIPPAPATDIRALNSGGTVLVTWTASVDDAQTFTVFGDGFVRTTGLSGYRIYRAVQSAEPELIGTTAPGVVEFTDPAATTGVTYVYSVRPFDADNETVPVITPGSADDLARTVALGGGVPDVVVVRRVKARLTFDVILDLADAAAVTAFSNNFTTLTASLLGIDASRITITSITQGSTIVDFEIADVEGDGGTVSADQALSQLLVITADTSQNAFASIGPLLNASDESVDNVVVIPLPVDAFGNIVLSWFSRAGTAVGFDDFFLFADNFGLSEGQFGYDAKYDIVPNSQVDFDDFFRFADDFGTPISNAAEIQALLTP